MADTDKVALLPETTLPGVFVAGHVRSGSVKRVVSTAGERAMAVRLVHEYREKAGNLVRTAGPKGPGRWRAIERHSASSWCRTRGRNDCGVSRNAAVTWTSRNSAA
ncbi:hypothetical protein ACIO93_36620 [Streptomyces sp. NPDC087903]|uniref:hypothetical protein n=1 Tax=Streptomyces sp. NPDC087903 TaxID=3365819 RepID=UPI00380DB25C